VGVTTSTTPVQAITSAAAVPAAAVREPASALSRETSSRSWGAERSPWVKAMRGLSHSQRGRRWYANCAPGWRPHSVEPNQEILERLSLTGEHLEVAGGLTCR